MAAILPFLEQNTEGESVRPEGFGGFGAVSAPPDPSSTIADLTRMHWMREELTKLLAEREFRVGPKDDGELAIFLNRDIPKDALPWSGSVHEVHGKTVPYNLYAPTNTKMKCPIFDLPSGAPHIGGTCPGAMAGQFIVPEADRRDAAASMLPPPGYKGHQNGTKRGAGSMPIDVERSICSRCYAGKGNYISPFAQAGEMVRYWWARQCANNGKEGRDEFVRTMVYATRAIVPKRPDRHGIKPVRIHSSGDFFSPAYFRLWMDVVVEVERLDPTIVFWFPTRVWGFRGYDWALLDKLKRSVVRPSAYHMDDSAPEKLRPTNARGTTAIYHDSNLGVTQAFERLLNKSSAGRYSVEVYERNRSAQGYREAYGYEHDQRYDWPCQTYAIGPSGKDLSASCTHAIAPDGQVGCRACWTSKNLRIAYTAH